MEVQLRLLSQTEAKTFTENNLWLDHTRATAIHTCPRWGVIRYMHGKALETAGRAMALEAGNAMHQAFAAHRIWQLASDAGARNLSLDNSVQSHVACAVDTGLRVFGDERWPQLEKHLSDSSPNAIALEALYTSGYYDDPIDKRRTLSNMEQSLLMYLGRYESEYIPLVVGDFVGIEVPVRIGLAFADGTQFMYTGRVDGVLSEPGTGNPLLVENKTASNVGNQWEVQWRTSHQITGYMAGVGLQLGQSVDRGVVVGLQIPLPRTSDYRGYVWSSLNRTTRSFGEWLKWTLSAWQIWQTYQDTPFDAPMYTHSCYRYFRPCSFVPICDIAEDDPPVELSELIDDSWHPEPEG